MEPLETQPCSRSKHCSAQLNFHGADCVFSKRASWRWACQFRVGALSPRRQSCRMFRTCSAKHPEQVDSVVGSGWMPQPGGLLTLVRSSVSQPLIVKGLPPPFFFFCREKEERCVRCKVTWNQSRQVGLKTEEPLCASADLSSLVLATRAVTPDTPPCLKDSQAWEKKRKKEDNDKRNPAEDLWLIPPEHHSSIRLSTSLARQLCIKQEREHQREESHAGSEMLRRLCLSWTVGSCESEDGGWKRAADRGCGAQTQKDKKKREKTVLV